ncbi:unnamed protein product [Heligmosomoides polygyrus]|uniref:ASD2 domain-containing protein n=1 Tax=Heligmosomoides polygyrus TaxID=6339 RepID=A0A183G0X7_HELPZ|nr:unnamed protein product [Heligmosomoides polygyrus]
MEDSLEDRICAIEKALGIDECADAKPSDFDVAALQARMHSLGLDRVMKIPMTKLKNLRNLASKPHMQPLSERLATIEFCEDLIRKRAELLKEFEERLQVVLKTDKIAMVAQQEKQLEKVQQDILKSLEEWQQYTMELDTFKTEYFSVMGALRERLDEMDRVVARAESESEA